MKGSVSNDPIVLNVKIPATIDRSEVGDYVAKVIKKNDNILIVPDTIEAITNASTNDRGGRRLEAVQLTFSPKSSPAKLSFKWADKNI